MFMPKRPVSVTLDAQNLLWLRGQTIAGRHRSLSEALDDVVSEARLGGRVADRRSVAGTIDIAGTDLDLTGADAAVAALYHASLTRPVLARETAPAYGRGKKATSRG
jgi:hypothetical protein